MKAVFSISLSLILLLALCLTGCGESISGKSPIAVLNYQLFDRDEHQYLLDASNSYDPDGYIEAYAWDTNNDGSFGQKGDGSKGTIVLDNDGTYRLGVKVYDNDNKTDTAYVTINVNWDDDDNQYDPPDDPPDDYHDDDLYHGIAAGYTGNSSYAFAIVSDEGDGLSLIHI